MLRIAEYIGAAQSGGPGSEDILLVYVRGLLLQSERGSGSSGSRPFALRTSADAGAVTCILRAPCGRVWRITPLVEKWRLEHPHDTPPHPLMTLPTSAHSSPGAGGLDYKSKPACCQLICHAVELSRCPRSAPLGFQRVSIHDHADPDTD